MVAELPGELLTDLVLIGGASVLVRMLCVCKAWRSVLNAHGDGLWERLARRRFPRLQLILRHAPAERPFRILYSQQLAAEQVSPPPEPEPLLPQHPGWLQAGPRLRDEQGLRARDLEKKLAEGTDRDKRRDGGLNSAE